MEENISLYDLLNLSIGTPHRGSVNFSALHALLLAVLKQLDIREVKTRWRYTPPGDEAPDTRVGVPVEIQNDLSVSDDLVRPGSELQKSANWVSAPDDIEGLRPRIQNCEDGVSQALKLIEELQKHKEDLQEKSEELQQQQKAAAQQLETLADVEQCCHRVDTLEKAVNSLKDNFQRYPAPEELSQCVTLDFVQSVLKNEKPQKEFVTLGVSDRPMLVNPTGPPHTALSSSPLHDESCTTSAASGSPNISGEDLTSQAAADATEVSSDGSEGGVISGHPSKTTGPTPEDVASSILPGSIPKISGPTAADVIQTQDAFGLDRYQETVEAVRDIRKLQERFNELEAHMVVLEKQKVDRSELAHLRQLNTYKASQDASNNLTEQLQQHRALIESLMGDHEKLESLEDMLMTLMNQDRGSSSEAALDSVDADSKALWELSQQVSYLRKSLFKVEEDMKHLRVKQALCEERSADQHLQDQLDDLRGMLEDMILSLTSQLSSSLQDEAVQGENEMQDLSESTWRSALTFSSVNIGRKLSLLFQHYEQLQDTVNGLIQQQQQGGGRAGRTDDREANRVSAADSQNMELVCDVQRTILQLQAECKHLQEITRNLHEDNRQKQGHIEELYKAAEELEVKKADKQMVESEIKADKSALESKVSRLQFDVATEQLNSMFHELLNKVTGQEEDWHKVIDRLSTEMECKLNRIELDSVKMQLEDRWRSIHKKLQAQSAPEQEDAAGIRKQLVERFHCLSCDRPIMKQTPGPILVTLPSFPAFPPQKSIRPWTLEQIRQHYRSLTPGSRSVWMAQSGRRRAQLQKSHADMCRQIESIETQRRLRQMPAGLQHERVSEVTARSCGGNHTNISSSQRRCGTQHTRLLTQAEGDDMMQEADIVGLDGRIYKGRFNVHELRSTETKLPMIAPKDAAGKMKEKPKSSAPQRPAVSPEVGSDALVHPQPLSAKSMQCSRSASSGSGRDWPVSALGCCTSQSSITQASAAADSIADPESCEPLNL